MTARDWFSLYFYFAAWKFIEYSVLYFIVGTPITRRVYRFEALTVLAVAALAVAWLPFELVDTPRIIRRAPRGQR